MSPRRLLLPVLLSLLLAGSTMSGAGASGRVATAAAVPATTLTLAGFGYGHGHGLSQYGAQGAALQGLSYRDILRFYYPGTLFASTRSWVKVLLSADDDGNVVVRPAGGLAVRDLGNRATYRLPDNGASAWRISGRAGALKVAYYTDRWRNWSLPTTTLVGTGQFLRLNAKEQAVPSWPTRLVTPSGEVSYRGYLRWADGQTVNYLPMNHYLRGVVAGEMPASWRRAALRAQVIAARTYATYEQSTRRGRSWEVCDTSQCQVYGGVGAEDPRTNAAISLSPTQYLTYGGNPAFTQFHASSGGWTAQGSQPYLPAREDPYDDYAGNRVHTWRVTVSAAPLERAYPQIGEFVRLRIWKRDGNGAWGGRVVTARVVGTDGAVTLSGDDVRGVLGLRSSWFRNA